MKSSFSRISSFASIYREEGKEENIDVFYLFFNRTA